MKEITIFMLLTEEILLEEWLMIYYLILDKKLICL